MEKNRIERYSEEYFAALERMEELMCKAELKLMGIDLEEVAAND